MQKSKQTKKKSVTRTQNPTGGAVRTRKTSMPAAFVPRNKAAGAQMSMRQSGSRDGKVLIRNEEYLMDLTNAQNYTVTSVSVNPGLSSVFLWLSSIANNYEFYQFKTLRIHYRPMVGTATAGQLMMAMDYDAADEPPATKQQFLSYMGAVSGPVYSSLSLDLPKVNMEKFCKEKFTRRASVPNGKDIKTYDLGNLLIASNAGTGLSSGSIFLDYSVELSTPHTHVDAPYESSAVLYGGGVNKEEPFKNAVLANADTSDPLMDRGPTLSSFILKKAGQYLVNFLPTGTGITAAGIADLFVVAGDAASRLESSGTVINGLATGGSVLGKISTTIDDRIVSLNPGVYTTLTGQSLRVSPYSFALA